MRPRERIVVVGAGLAGAMTCQALRRHGFAGTITLLGSERHPPYDRPPLTKGFLAGTRNDVALGIDLKALSVDAKYGVTATALDLADHTVQTTNGVEPFDGLVIATGARPLTLPGPGHQQCVRTVDDSIALRARLVPAARVVVVGASWIGAEVTTAALARGCSVTCIEALPTVSYSALGAVGHRLKAWWANVDLRLSTVVDRIENDAVHLADGTSIPADVVVVGIGVRPEVEWLRSSGLAIERGVVVDEHLLAHPDVVVVGDAGAWWSHRYGRRLCVEHWENASASAAVASASLLNLDGSPIYDPVPYFWSDQFGHKIQYVGAHTDESRLVVREGDGRWSAAWVDMEDRLVAALVIDQPRELQAARRVIHDGQPLSQRRLADGSIAFADVATD